MKHRILCHWPDMEVENSRIFLINTITMQLFFARQPGQLLRSKNEIKQVNPLINLAHRSLFFATFVEWRCRTCKNKANCITKTTFLVLNLWMGLFEQLPKTPFLVQLAGQVKICFKNFIKR